MARVALITGSPGARQQALELELAGAGWTVRKLAFEGIELPDLLAAARGAEAVFHVGIRTSREHGTQQRADAEATAAYAAGRAALEARARRFVLVSTDKAVNPKTVYGHSKALCEWIVEACGAKEDITTRFVAVRFGNVLGSSGSVIPIFRRQIAKGGPVTVTHPEMMRYFMTMPEAASLVIQAGAIGGRGDVFVLDMGEPVRIIDLAMQMIRLSGKEPERDIDVEIVGARPGEKLHEELWGESETVVPTSQQKIMRVSGPIVDAAWLEE
ncbi:MAG TPA: polysaccharide biosynthesis protein, partial [Anaeromyxobacteraceae bacterium]